MSVLPAPASGLPDPPAVGRELAVCAAALLALDEALGAWGVAVDRAGCRRTLARAARDGILPEADEVDGVLLALMVELGALRR